MGQIWFGTRGYMQWVKDPASGMTVTQADWNTSTQLLNGKKYVRTSNNSHREFDLTWNLAHRSVIQPILDYANGVFGDTIYFVDPFVADRNILPLDWSVPMMGAVDGTILSGGENRPELVPTASNSFSQPYQGALYTNSTSDTQPELYIPIPPDYTLYLGFVGANGTGGHVSYAVANGTSTGSFTNLTPLALSSSDRTNASVASSSGDGVVIKLTGNGTVTITSMTAVLLPTSGSVTPSGAFISGGGTRGCQFASKPVIQAYSVGIDMVGLTATLIEVG